MPLGAGLGIAGIAGAGATIFGAQAGANAQQQAASQANQLQQQMFNTTQGNLNPFIQQGQSTNNILSYLLGTGGTGPGGAAGGQNGAGSLTSTFQPTMQQLAATPGYQFSLNQGEKSTQNSYAAQGLGSSGAALKGAAGYAQGLAANTYQQQFQNYLGQNNQIYNMLSGQAGMGESAAAGLGSIAQGTANSMNSNIIGAGNAQAGADVATGNAVAGGINSGVSSYMSYNLLQQMLANKATTAPGSGVVLGGAGGPGQFFT